MSAENPRIAEDETGASLILLILVISIVAVASIGFLMSASQNSSVAQNTSEIYEGKRQLLAILNDLVGQEMTLRNSLFSTNKPIANCLSSQDLNCDERTRYDFYAYPPTPYMISTALWSDPPADFLPISGSKAAYKVFYSPDGKRCPASVQSPDSQCPLQAYAEIRPLCGGTQDAPVESVPGGGACTTIAKGFRLYLGVISYVNGIARFTTSDEVNFLVSSSNFIR